MCIISSCAFLSAHFVQFCYGEKDLTSTQVVFWEFTNLTTTTESSNPFYLKYHFFLSLVL